MKIDLFCTERISFSFASGLTPALLLDCRNLKKIHEPNFNQEISLFKYITKYRKQKIDFGNNVPENYKC